MKKFVIITDSCSELTEDLRKQYDVDYLPLYVSYGDTSIKADLDWSEITPKQYYDIVRSDVRVFSSQVPAIEYQERFEKYAKQGYDILSISLSSALSSTVKSSMVARDEVKKIYPDTEIICIDSLISSFGLGILSMYASELRSQGKTIHEVATAVEELKMNVNQLGTVDELKYLKRAGRISATTAVFGTMLNIKPIIISNDKGENVSSEKAKGRMKSIHRLAELTKELYTGENFSGVYISHGDCIEDAEKLRSLILDIMPNVKVTIGILNYAMGASCGPNMLGVYFVGKQKPRAEG